jgi:hypothetical protein
MISASESGVSLGVVSELATLDDTSEAGLELVAVAYAEDTEEAMDSIVLVAEAALDDLEGGQ